MQPHLGELNKEEIEIIKGNKTKKARADISILDFDGFQKTSFFNICVSRPHVTLTMIMKCLKL